MPVQSDYSDISYNNGILSVMIGDTVYVNGEGDYRGKICFIGPVHFAKGEYAGVALDHPLGNHDGAHRGRRYFQCLPKHGVFAKIGKISKYPLIAATNDSERCGLYRETSPSRSYRESSPISSVGSSTGGSGTSGGGIGLGSYASSLRSFSKSPSPTPNLYSSWYSEKKRSESGGSSGSSTGSYRSSLNVGDRVIVASSVGETKTGVLRYLGPVEFASGEYAGIELFHPLGKNDGTVRGRHYFTCRHPYGLFVPSYKVESSPANKLGNKLGTKDNLSRILSYSTRLSGGGRVVRFAQFLPQAGSFDDDFY